MAIYSDLSREYQILDYSPTHSQLVIRSMKTSNENFNIDVIFKGVSQIIIPSFFSGLEISILSIHEEKMRLINNFDFKDNSTYNIFLLKGSQTKDYYINAMAFGVYQNNLEILQTSIGRYDWSNLGENQLWYS